MKSFSKVFTSVMGAVLLLSVFAGVALASGPNNGDGDGVRDLVSDGTTLGRQTARGFVDADGDGVNDRYLSESQEPQFVDEDGDGICDLYDGTQPLVDSYNYGYRYSFLPR